MNILYIVHDLSDATVNKRLKIFKSEFFNSNNLVVAGFRRTDNLPELTYADKVIDLGQTYNAKIYQRLLPIFRYGFCSAKLKLEAKNADILICRNLESLTIGQGIAGNKPLYYEILDIHKFLLRTDYVGSFVRNLEETLCKNISGIITSSPAFIYNYLIKYQNKKIPIYIEENKIFNPNYIDIHREMLLSNPIQWVIGWFGAIRCKKSLFILNELTYRLKGQLQVIIRGKPAYDEIPDFDFIIQDNPYLLFLGTYKNPEDLENIYGEVHFTWAIDMYEEGLNSSWLLPNRLYEGGAYRSIPIAIDKVETGKYLNQLRIGVILPEEIIENLFDFFSKIDLRQYNQLLKHVNDIDYKNWVLTSDSITSFKNFLT